MNISAEEYEKLVAIKVKYGEALQKLEEIDDRNSEMGLEVRELKIKNSEIAADLSNARMDLVELKESRTAEGIQSRAAFTAVYHIVKNELPSGLYL